MKFKDHDFTGTWQTVIHILSMLIIIACVLVVFMVGVFAVIGSVL